jgi:hypothetical protein
MPRTLTQPKIHNSADLLYPRSLHTARLANEPLRRTMLRNYSLKLGNIIRTSFITTVINGAWARAANSVTIAVIIGVRTEVTPNASN